MKKFLLSLILLMVLPIYVYALDIEDTNITGTESGKTGDTISVNFEIDFEKVDKNSTDGDGIAVVTFQFAADNTILSPVSYESDFETEIYYEGDTYTVVSAIKENMNNRCSDNVLFCGDKYQLKVDFFIKEHDETIESTTINFKEVALGTLKIGTEEVTEDKVNVITYNALSKHKITLEQGEITGAVPPSIVKEQDVPSIKDSIASDATTSKPSTPTPPKKTNNTFLKSLTIKDYDLAFDKNKDYYELYIDEDVNSLEVHVETEDSTSTYDIKGADDLKKADYRITIDVTAENKDKKTYTINVKTKHEYKEKEKEETVKIFKYDIKKRYVKYAIIALVVIIALIILKVVFRILKEHLGHRKYYKAVKNLKK